MAERTYEVVLDFLPGRGEEVIKGASGNTLTMDEDEASVYVSAGTLAPLKKAGAKHYDVGSSKTSETSEISRTSNSPKGDDRQGTEGTLETPDESRENQGTPIHASAKAQQRAEELGVSLADVKGTGTGGQITVRNVEQYAERQTDPANEISNGPIEE